MSKEAGESHVERVTAWPFEFARRKRAKRLAVHFLKTVPEHWSIHFIEQTLPDMHFVVAVHTDEPPVVRSVMDLAQRKPIGNYRLPVL